MIDSHLHILPGIDDGAVDILVKTNPQHIIDGTELESISMTYTPRVTKARKPVFSFFTRKK